jgi:hypothetical protein
MENFEVPHSERIIHLIELSESTHNYIEFIETVSIESSVQDI